MSLKINIDQNLITLPRFLNRLRTKALSKAVKHSLNRTVSSLRTKTNQEIRKERKLKAGDINRSFLKMDRAKGGNSTPIEALEAKLGVSNRKISLVRFVVGSKEPRPQRGIALRRRRPLRMEIKPGRRQRRKHLFLAPVSSSTQVFRRKGKRSLPIAKQSIPGLAKLVERDSFRAPLERFARDRYLKEFDSNFNFYLSKI